MKILLIITIIIAIYFGGLWIAIKTHNYLENKRLENLVPETSYIIETGRTRMVFDTRFIENYWGFQKEFPFFTTDKYLIKKATLKLIPPKE